MLWVNIHEQRFDKQAERNSKKGAGSAENCRPDDQGQETQRGGKPDGIPDHPRLDDGLNNEIQHRIDDDDDNGGHDILIEQSDDCRRHEADNETDVGNVVGDKCQQSPEPCVADIEKPQRYDVALATITPKMVATTKYWREP